MYELDKHVEANVFHTVIRYQASVSARMFGRQNESVISKAQVVLTTYQEASRNLPNGVQIGCFEADNVDFKGAKVIS